ncbi:MAG: cyclopropane-fatty-acyl-phospholipid synthase family protein [Gammaproteobacteria bacterium]|jgi:cyclopropane-fatty-acyl-phospholipid synthase
MDHDTRHNVAAGEASAFTPQATSTLARTGIRKTPLFNSRVTRFDRWLARAMLNVVGNPASTLRLWDGVEVNPFVANPVATILYRNRLAMFKTILNPELHWGDLYCNGQIEFNGDMTRFLEIVYRNINGNRDSGLLRRILCWLGHRRISNTRARAEENIHHHYDIGNDFYELWLDTEELQYTCAYFPDPAMSLEDAQIAKLHHVCRKLQLKPGDTVVEAGCGWGGLARFMARYYGVSVKAYNISKEQVAYARQRAESEGLSDRVEYILDDYRNIKAQCDVFVSVGMLEHVGTRDYMTLGKVIDKCLKPEGRGLIHSIGRINPGPMNAWIERRIFPGAYPPSLKEMMDIFEPYKLSVLDIENLRLHYAKTLEHWLERFEQHSETVGQVMDEEFIRAWRLYLAGSVAAFKVGELQLYQVLFARNTNNNLPWSRSYFYNDIPDKKSRLSIVQVDNKDA